ncbi:uncharacterized protein LOC103521598 [Diaphorina citri]|uniref:Uncharacterized protein LOC103521598 n=1 Tax=Diaphorina citri TaxID=121845 RepID=A0A1S3DMQ0_DIACI|nr:uncharacterized protein LOC103521598 [Diaphorina citri]
MADFAPLRKELQSRIEERNALRAEYKQLTKKLAKRVAQADTLQGCCANVKQAVREIDYKRQKQREIVEALQKQLGEQTGELKSFGDLKSLEPTCAHLEEENERLKEKLEDAHKINQALNQGLIKNKDDLLTNYHDETCKIKAEIQGLRDAQHALIKENLKLKESIRRRSMVEERNIRNRRVKTNYTQKKRSERNFW